MSTPTPPRDSAAPPASPPASPRKSWFTLVKGLVLSLFGLGFVAGVVAWGGFNWSLELTNTEAFCISCHEMKENVYKESRNSRRRYSTNRSGPTHATAAPRSPAFRETLSAATDSAIRHSDGYSQKSARSARVLRSGDAFPSAPMRSSYRR